MQNMRFSVIFADERKEDQTKIPGECPPRNVLGISRMAHPDHYSLAHCKADNLYHVVEMDIFPRGRDGHYFRIRPKYPENVRLTICLGVVEWLILTVVP